MPCQKHWCDTPIILRLLETDMEAMHIVHLFEYEDAVFNTVIVLQWYFDIYTMNALFCINVS